MRSQQVVILWEVNRKNWTNIVNPHKKPKKASFQELKVAFLRQWLQCSKGVLKIRATKDGTFKEKLVRFRPLGKALYKIVVDYWIIYLWK